MEPQLIEWLLPFRKPRGSIVGPEFVDTLRAIKQAAGFTFGDDDSNPWIKDVLRHCYGSYWLAMRKDRAHLAELMGTSLDMIKSRYRRATPETIAKELWKLLPPENPASYPDYVVGLKVNYAERFSSRFSSSPYGYNRCTPRETMNSRTHLNTLH